MSHLCVGEVPCLLDGLDDNIFLLFPVQMEGIVFLEVSIVAVDVGVDIGGIPFVVVVGGGGGGL